MAILLCLYFIALMSGCAVSHIQFARICVENGKNVHCRVAHVVGALVFTLLAMTLTFLFAALASLKWGACTVNIVLVALAVLWAAGAYVLLWKLPCRWVFRRRSQSIVASAEQSSGRKSDSR